MPNKQYFLSFGNFEKGLNVLYVRDLPVLQTLVVNVVDGGVAALDPVKKMGEKKQ